MEDEFFPASQTVGNAKEFPWKSTALHVARWSVHHFQQVWRMVVSVVLSVIIYTLFSWLPKSGIGNAQALPIPREMLKKYKT
jgi:hypothetical protein